MFFLGSFSLIFSLFAGCSAKDPLPHLEIIRAQRKMVDVVPQIKNENDNRGKWGHNFKVEKVKKVERIGIPKVEKVEKPEVEKVGKPEVEKVEKQEFEKVENPEVEKVEKPEVEKVERVEVEKVEVGKLKK